MTKISQAPVGTRRATETNMKESVACHWCDYFSQKVFLGCESYDGAAVSFGSGKCFLDYEKRGRAYYVDSKMLCPRFTRARGNQNGKG